jgi:heterotetrameric sarcosine oxidase gamma subunit
MSEINAAETEMNTLAWTDSFAAPRSLATRGDTAVAIIEDPGVIDIVLEARDSYLLRRANKLIGVKLPTAPWETSEKKQIRTVWMGPWRWRVILPRDRVPELLAAFREDIESSVLSDLTGGFACFRIIGGGAGDILARVCPLDLRSLDAHGARGTSIAGVKSLLIREAEPATSWLVLAPRSYAEHVARALTEAARTPGRLSLFEPAKPPPV